MKCKIEYESLLVFIILSYIVIIPHTSLLIKMLIYFIALILNLKHFHYKFKHYNMLFVLGSMTIGCTLLYTFLLNGESVLSQNVIQSYNINVEEQNITYFIYISFALLIIRLISAVIEGRHGKKVLIYIEGIFVVMLLLFLAFYIIQLLNYDLYSKFRSFYYVYNVDMRNNEVLVNANYFLRFGFIFLDPNNCGYSIAAIAMYLNIVSEKSIVRRLALITLLVVPIATVSRGSALSIIAFFSIKLVIRIINRRKMKIGEVILLFILVFIFAVLLIQMVSGNIIFEGNDIFNRLFMGDDSRFEIWKTVIEKLKIPPLIGTGYVLSKNGIYIKPHSDILRVLYGYGILVVLFFAIFIRKNIKINKRALALIPIGIAFLLNSVLDEQRVLYIAALIFACCIEKRRDNFNYGKEDMLNHK